MNTTKKSSFKIDDILGNHVDTIKRQNEVRTNSCCNFNGTSYHLTSLFSTLIHHKKCRRTRTVFSGMFLLVFYDNNLLLQQFISHLRCSTNWS
jgi:hypothetical protein